MNKLNEGEEGNHMGHEFYVVSYQDALDFLAQENKKKDDKIEALEKQVDHSIDDFATYCAERGYYGIRSMYDQYIESLNQKKRSDLMQKVSQSNTKRKK